MTTMTFSGGWSRAAAAHPLAFAAVVLARRFRRYLKHRDSRRRLAALPDHLLKDVGITPDPLLMATIRGRSRL